MRMWFPLMVAALWMVMTALTLREVALLAGATASHAATRPHPVASTNRPALSAVRPTKETRPL
jgi:hypothetical protein